MDNTSVAVLLELARRAVEGRYENDHNFTSVISHVNVPNTPEQSRTLPAIPPNPQSSHGLLQTPQSSHGLPPTAQPSHGHTPPTSNEYYSSLRKEDLLSISPNSASMTLTVSSIKLTM